MNAGRNFVKCLECGEIIHLPDDTEDNQPQAESGTTGCSDAGGGDTPSKPGRSADWQAKIDELWTVIEKDFVALDRLINGSLMDQIATYREMISRHYRLMGRLVEERRRSEERT